MEHYRGRVNPNWLYRIVDEEVLSLNFALETASYILDADVPRNNKEGYAEISKDTFDYLLRRADMERYIICDTIKSKMLRAF